MKSLSQNVWLIIAALVAIFLCGSGSGYVFGSLDSKGKPGADLEPKSSSAWSEEALAAMRKSLSLTPQQMVELAPIIGETGEKVTRERERALFQIHLNILKVHDDIRPLLKPQQQKELDLSRQKMVESIELRFSSLIGREGVPNPTTPETP